MNTQKDARNAVQIAEALSARYGDFNHYNLSDPLSELLFIICSTKTDEANYRASFASLIETFPNNNCLAAASIEEIAQAIKIGGLSMQKAKAIRGILDRIKEEFGAVTLEPLRTWVDKDIEHFLLSLPSVGKKVARCVMMYSLGREVFPVDTHCWRIARRIGWVRRTYTDGRCSPKDMDRLQDKLPPSLRYSLHVNFVSLGREICVAGLPRCEECPISQWCRKIGVKRTRLGNLKESNAGMRVVRIISPRARQLANE